MKIEKITYAGHSAVFLHSDKFTIAIDPWLNGNPLCPENLKNPEQLDLIVLTHGHSDHAGDAVTLMKKYGCKLAATFELATVIAAQGVPGENLIYMNTGGSIKFHNFTIKLTPAWHSNSYETDKGSVYAGMPNGVLINDGSQKFYHAGDTALFSDLKLIGELHSPEYVFLPIGDTFTMGPKEAALAASWLRAKKAIPIHYKTFPMLEQDAAIFISGCEKYGIEALELTPGISLPV